jgi:hypothetical protein
MMFSTTGVAALALAMIFFPSFGRTQPAEAAHVRR